jgi:hypothetical protein
VSDFVLQISEEERALLVLAIGASCTTRLRLRDVPLINLLRRLLEAPKLSGGQTHAQAPPVGIPAPVKVARKAPPASSPEPAAPARDSATTGELAITPIKVDQPEDGKSMVVHYQVRTAAGAKVKVIRCWDPSYFGSILDTVGQATTFLTKTNAQGFTNIVGVKR